MRSIYPKEFRALLLILAFATTTRAAPAPHPTLPGRLVDTRDGLTVEYSPGQEAWVRMAFDRLRAAATQPHPRFESPGPALPASARDLHDRRDAWLAAVARQVGFSAPTELQRRTFDTFLGYYDEMTELVRTTARLSSEQLVPRRVAIWQRDDLVARLRSGQQIDGMKYDRKTDQGTFNFDAYTTLPPETSKRIEEIRNRITSLGLRHSFNRSAEGVSASFTLGASPSAATREPDAIAPASKLASKEIVIPVIYKGDFATEPTSEAFGTIEIFSNTLASEMAKQMETYRDPSTVLVILHETAEVGLVGSVIQSADRRWLCDGTANYVAWRVARDLAGSGFARQVYDIDAQLARYASLQTKIDLAHWAAATAESAAEADNDLNRAHYAFATRVMFILTTQHGEAALSDLWHDVAKTPVGKVSAKTFANAYRKRYHEPLEKLIAEAQRSPLHPAD